MAAVMALIVSSEVIVLRGRRSDADETDDGLGAWQGCGHVKPPFRLQGAVDGVRSTQHPWMLLRASRSLIDTLIHSEIHIDSISSSKWYKAISATSGPSMEGPAATGRAPQISYDRHPPTKSKTIASPFQ